MRTKAVLLVMLLMAAGGWLKDANCQTNDVDTLQIQGEYSGVLPLDGTNMKVGAQLIDVGSGEFKVTMYGGGLPGDGWEKEDDDARKELGPAKLEDGKISFSKQEFKVVYENGEMTIFLEGKLVGKLTRVERQSPTLNQAAPTGALVLFDGTTGDRFERYRAEGDPMIDGLLRQGINSKDKFDGDFTLHIEFKLPFEPTKSGQGRANSGIYVQGRYEVQMLDSFGLLGEHNECGGIYSIKKPDENMCYPPESWQTYDIDFKSARWEDGKKTEDARMTVKHNGVLIHDDVEVPKITTAAPTQESAEPGCIYLQDHGSPVRYRNIWFMKK